MSINVKETAKHALNNGMDAREAVEALYPHLTSGFTKELLIRKVNSEMDVPTTTRTGAYEEGRPN